MNHFYHHIFGWFDWQDIYRDQVAKAKDGDVFVEVGVHLGKSAAFMAVEILNSKKDITFYCVDIWKDEQCYQDFLRNIKPVESTIKVVRSLSTKFKTKCDFAFIDAAHDYDNVNADIKHWKKYAKTLAGHDYTDYWPGVKQAVNEHFKTFEVKGNCWYVGRV